MWLFSAVFADWSILFMLLKSEVLLAFEFIFDLLLICPRELAEARQLVIG